MKIPDRVKKAYNKAKLVINNAYAPHSRFRVGACVVDTKGRSFTGCNVENSAFGSTICAERFAIGKAVSEGSRKFTDLVLLVEENKVSYPCGSCRQVMGEFLKPNAKIWLATLKEIVEVKKMGDLLPNAYGPRKFK
jgi:cytidine deaminase